MTGVGNIGPDDAEYVSADSTVREGVYGEPSHHGQPEYSAGRGGAGNMVPSPRINPSEGPGSAVGGSVETMPEGQRVGENYADFHTGRGGEGNVHRDKFGGHSHPPKEQKEGHGGGLLEKAKHAVGMDKKKGEGSSST